MSKDLNINLLLDIYGELLTARQRDALELYYADDLSLTEISWENGISRQGVFRIIKTAEEKLKTYENCIGAARRLLAIKKSAEKISARLAELGINDPQVNGLLRSIEEEL